ncbi:hypothetical protein AQJ23_03075 [Streptomyces antibioticus]|nr:hypothetical protein [Streptomyces antibioticus]KUN29745.1 hypothetical protein AQJ23_03075 [Streptomyces antibioticus]
MVHLKQPRLSGLGRNPAAPLDVLVRLATHRAGRHGLETRKGQLPDVVVEALLTHGGSDSAVLLRGGRISPAMRHRIAEHPDPAIRDAHADFIRTMVERGVSTGIENLVEAYGRPPAELAVASDPKLRAIVAEAWRDRPMAVQVALLHDPDPGVRAAATRAKHPGVPPELYAHCLADPAVQANVACFLPLTSDQFARLLKTEDKAVLQAVARNPHLTADMVVQLQDCADPSVRFAVAFSRHVTAETRDRLLALVEAEKAAGSVDAYVALDWPSYEPDWLRDAPLAERLTYLDSPHAVFRRVLAAGRDLPDEAWQRLDDDPDVSVRRAAARRPGTPPQVLVRLLRAHGDVSHIRPLLVDHPNFPRQVLRGFVDQPDPQVRVLALKDPELPVSVLRRFADFEEGFLRAGAARHPNVTAELLERLLTDPEPKVADDAAANPMLPRAQMDRILTEARL